MNRLFFGLVGALLVCSARAGLFKDGETVCFLGDSITHGGRFHSYIYDYYLTRFPARTVRFVNAGVSGDSAGGALGRLADDVVAKRPTAVAVMFGMNDVGRGLYVAEPGEQQRAGQQRALENYRANMERLTARLKAEAGEPRLLFVTPSPFDQTGVNDRNNNQPGCNDGLARCAETVRELAGRNKGTVVDFLRR
jgi:lysophospholipase L1-like esterase